MIRVHRIEATPAEDRFTWEAELGPQFYRLGNVQALLDRAVRDGAPFDGTVQLSGDRLYVHWSRPA